MNVLIVYAHHDPKSFNGALRDCAVAVLGEAGHSVQVSDLYAMSFKASAGADDFTETPSAEGFKYPIEQARAYENGTLASDIQAEQDKLRWCNALILQFPLWWFSLPAVLKGWVDRVFTAGFVYGDGMWYDNGGLKGRRAMLSLTTGGPEKMYARDGINGDINDILFHINHGMLFFAGFQVLPPFIAWAPAHVDDQQRAAYLEQYRQRLLAFETTEPVPYPGLAHYK